MRPDPGGKWASSGESRGLVATLGEVPRSGRWILPALDAAFGGEDVLTIDLRIRALMLLRVAAVDRSPYWRARAEEGARELGISQDQMILVASDEWESTPSLEPREGAAILWADRVARRLARRDMKAFAVVRGVFTDSEIVELTLIASLMVMADRITNSLRIAPETESRGLGQPGPRPNLEEWPSRMFDSDLAEAWEAACR